MDRIKAVSPPTMNRLKLLVTSAGAGGDASQVEKCRTGKLPGGVDRSAAQVFFAIVNLLAGAETFPLAGVGRFLLPYTRSNLSFPPKVCTEPGTPPVRQPSQPKCGTVVLDVNAVDGARFVVKAHKTTEDRKVTYKEYEVVMTF